MTRLHLRTHGGQVKWQVIWRWGWLPFDRESIYQGHRGPTITIWSGGPLSVWRLVYRSAEWTG